MPWSNKPGLCERCGNPVADPVKQAYCSDACRQAAYRQRRKEGKRSERKSFRKFTLHPEWRAWVKKLKKRARQKGEE